MNYYQRRRKAFGYAFKGLKNFSREPHARIHFAAAVMAVVLGFWLQITAWEWVAVLLCTALVISLEMINSALETLTDLASPDWSKAAEQIKDVAAGAVLVSALASLLIGILIFLPKILVIFNL